METREVFRFGGVQVLTTVDGYVSIKSLWRAGGSPRDHNDWREFLNDHRTRARIDTLRSRGFVPTICDTETGDIFIEKFLASEYAEDLNVELWLAFRKYIFGDAPTDGRTAPYTMPSELANDPFIQLRIHQLEIEKTADRASAKADAASREVAQVREQIGRGPRYWTVSAWFSHHGVKADLAVCHAEGIALRKISEDLGYDVAKEKVCSGSMHPTRPWQLEAFWVWWPDYCRRTGRKLFWQRGCEPRPDGRTPSGPYTA